MVGFGAGGRFVDGRAGVIHAVRCAGGLGESRSSLFEKTFVAGPLSSYNGPMVTTAIVALVMQLSGSVSLGTDPDGVATAPTEHPAPEILEWVNPSRVELRTPIGPLPFVIESGVSAYDDSFSKSQMLAALHSAVRVVNGDHATITRSVEVHATGYLPGSTKPAPRSFARIEFPEHGSTLSGSRGQTCVVGAPIGDYMPLGTWRVARDGFTESVSFTTKRAKSLHDRFDPIETATPTADLPGTWLVRLEESNQRATGRFSVDGHRVEAELITPGGVLRHFGGRVDGDLLRLSYYDGHDAFLIHASLRDDGSLEGVLWEGDWRQEPWRAVRSGR